MSPRSLAVFVPLVLLALGSCAEDEPPDLTGMVYASMCDPDATISFEDEDSAVVNRNGCEGYASEPWDYVIDGDELIMAFPGRLDDPSFVKERFRVSADASTLTLTSDYSFFACGNCQTGDQWVRQ